MTAPPPGGPIVTFDPPWHRYLDERDGELRAMLRQLNRCRVSRSRIAALAGPIHRSCSAARSSLDFDGEEAALNGGRRVRHKPDHGRVAQTEAAAHAVQDRLSVAMPRAVRWSAPPPVRVEGHQGGEGPAASPEPTADEVGAAVASWRAFMAAQDHAPEPEPGPRPGRPPSNERLFVMEEIARAYTALRGKEPGRTSTLRAKPKPSPFERFALAVLRLYGLPDTYGTDGAASWVTAARTRQVVARRRQRGEVFPRAN